jgi:membrane protein YqaA with SNARE-associated domain
VIRVSGIQVGISPGREHELWMTAHLTQWIAAHGLIAVFVLMAVDAVLPAGGELVMLFAGALAAGAIAGHHGPSLVVAILVGTLGYLAGSLAGWALGRAGGRALVERHGRWLHLGPNARNATSNVRRLPTRSPRRPSRGTTATATSWKAVANQPTSRSDAP